MGERVQNVSVGPTVSREPGTENAQGVFAARDFAAGERIGTFVGTETAVRTRMSLQFGPERHIEPGESDSLRFLNHACEPNAVFTGRDLHARVAIPVGVEITIDYTCHEPEMASPFICACGSAQCLGLVRGGRHLTAAQRQARGDRLQDWLRERGEIG